jgi:uncharacterized membrane protein YhhN
VNKAQIALELVVAVSSAAAFVRYWRQLVALAVAVIVVLSMIGAMTVISWFGAATHP